MSGQLVLFDIDHTLVDVLRFHEPVYAEVLGKTFGIAAGLRDVSFSGKTTPNILRELALRHGVEEARFDAAQPDLVEDFNRGVIRRLDLDLRASVLPGIVALLRCLHIAGSVLGVVTGNPPAIGRAVLERSQLLRYFTVFAFGTEARERAELVALAAEKARRELGRPFAPHEVVVVGDSPHDVIAGRRYGARTVALATGLSERAELEQAGPDLLFQDCGDYERICAAITAKHPRRLRFPV